MSKRIATLLLGIGLIAVGSLFFIAPEQAFAVRWLMRLWPAALILAGLVRVSGYLIDRHPRSPMGGMMITAIGGILLSANLLGHNSIVLILGKYWFWMLLAFVAGRLLKQYTHRIEDGLRPKTFPPGAWVVMGLIVGAGLTASFASKSPAGGIDLNLRLGGLGVSDYVFGEQIPVEDEIPQSFAIAPNSRLFIHNVKGDIEINSAPQSQATARLIRRLRVANVEEAQKVAKNINLQITSNGVGHQFNVAAEGVEQDFGVSIIITLPQNLHAGVEINNALGVVKIADLQGVHVIRGCERAEITRNFGGVTVENPRGAVELSEIQGPVFLANTRQAVNLRAINGPVTLDVNGGNVNLQNSSGPLKLRATEAQIDITEIGGGSPATARVIDIEQARSSRIKLQEIKGAVAIKAERSRVEAQEISGNFKLDSSSERVRVARIDGELSIKSENGSVEAEEIRGLATIEATRDVTVRNFRGPLTILSQEGAIDLETSEKLDGNISVIGKHGKIRVSLPKDSSFRLDANAGEGRVKANDNFDSPEWSRQDRSYVTGYNITADSPMVSLRLNRGEIQLRSSGLAMASQN
ncbi:MAG TPA: DUF4097 family beta strand repeat-containing protein [Blastocatellia bacterium]|jgi:DUF4097 and DUF4098 domain-containing protein YvlB|nr:DUF4097 family beta strand repeat-containing protein [Blastocatellia bacterium]